MKQDANAINSSSRNSSRNNINIYFIKWNDFESRFKHNEIRASEKAPRKNNELRKLKTKYNEHNDIELQKKCFKGIQNIIA